MNNIHHVQRWPFACLYEVLNVRYETWREKKSQDLLQNLFSLHFFLTSDSVNRNDKWKSYSSGKKGDNEAPPPNFVQTIAYEKII